MENLNEFKVQLKQSLAGDGITAVLKALKGVLPENAPPYNLLIQLESEYREVKLRIIEGVLDNEEVQKANNLIRKRLLDFIDDLKEEDFSGETPASFYETDHRVRTGHILYQIPHTMQLGKESRCRVRIAFEKKILIEDLDLDENTEIRANVRISDYMKVELLDPAEEAVFVIRTQSEPIQFIDKDDYTEWRFFVKPLQAGEHLLELKVTIMVMINGREVPRERVLEESVVIITGIAEETDEGFRQMVDTFQVGMSLGLHVPEAKPEILSDIPSGGVSPTRIPKFPPHILEVEPQVLPPAPQVLPPAKKSRGCTPVLAFLMAISVSLLILHIL